MRNALFPHMEWAKAHTRNPLPVELGFSGAAHPRGRTYREHGSGHPALERRIGRKYGVSPDHVFLAGGASLANFLAIAALCDPGETVAVESPRYAPFAAIPRSLGATVVDVRHRADRPFGPIPKKAKLAVVSSPHNPTGKVFETADWDALKRFGDRGGVVIVDEVYRDVASRPPPVAATRHPRFLTTGSFTKVYGLGGLRVGWVLGTPELLAQVRRVDNLVAVECATPSLLALEKIWPRLPELRRRAVKPIRENLVTLRAAGLEFIEPDAGLTALVEVGDGDATAAAMEKEGIGLASGSFFDAPGYVRIFLGARPAAFRKGVRELARYLESSRSSRAMRRKKGR